MTRQEFIKRCAALGLGASMFPNLLLSCKNEQVFFDDFDVNFSGKVLIIGAGAAGLTAGHVLNQYNIDFEILEASSVYGGRVKEIQGFADFPIDLGAEWIHTDPSILATLLNDPTSSAKIDIINYAPETLYFWKDNKLRKRNFFANFYAEHKFKSTTWFSFFDNYIVPGIRDRIILNSPVREIDYTTDQISVTTTNDEIFEADRVIVTVPLTILKNQSISFVPEYPSDKRTALQGVDMPDGIKVFMEFSQRFYPDILYDGGLSQALGGGNGEKIYYDAAFRKESDRNVLGLFTVGQPASIYTNQATEEQLMSYILDELDTIFGGKASTNYVKHVVQNWSNEPYIQGSYSHYDDYSIQEILARPIDNKIYFAGEAYAESDATVHGAGLSAFGVVEEILAS